MECSKWDPLFTIMFCHSVKCTQPWLPVSTKCVGLICLHFMEKENYQNLSGHGGTEREKEDFIEQALLMHEQNHKTGLPKTTLHLPSNTQ